MTMYRKTVHIPARTEPTAMFTLVHSTWASSWERSYRQVFGLADGQRSSERIAQLLHKPIGAIEQIVSELLLNGYLKIKVEEKEVFMNARLLKESFALITPRKEQFAHAFYERLFQEYPHTKPLFAKTDMRRQESSLMATLAVVITGVEKKENLIPVLHQLGERHARSGVRSARQYALVGDALLKTFADFLHEQFTPEMKQAWIDAYGVISTEMLRAASFPSSSMPSVPESEAEQSA